MTSIHIHLYNSYWYQQVILYTFYDAICMQSPGYDNGIVADHMILDPQGHILITTVIVWVLVYKA